MKDKNKTDIFFLPNDILKTNLRSYLTLKELSALVRTCKSFNTIFMPQLLEEKTKKLLIPLLEHVVKGDIEKAEKIIQQHPELLLLKASTPITDYSFRQIIGTALQIALGAEDVNFRSCELILLTSRSPEDKLRSKLSCSAAYIRLKDKLYYIDEIYNREVEITVDEKVLKEFDKTFNPNIVAQFLSEKQLQKITALTGHVHEEQMAEMIKRYLRRLPDGCNVIEAQTREQFPNGWLIKAKQKLQDTIDTLDEVVAAIGNSKENSDCKAALKKFKQCLKPNGVITSGKHFDIQLLIYALDLFWTLNNKDKWDSRKLDLFWIKVIGVIQRYLPACYAQILCQGSAELAQLGRMFIRSFNLLFNAAAFFPLDIDPTFRLGHEYAVNNLGSASTTAVQSGPSSHLQAIKNKKDQSYEDVYAIENHIDRNCILM